MAYFDFAPWNEFLNDIRTAEEQLGNPSRVWYRGVSDATHTLQPSLLRRSNGIEKERDLFLRYRSVASQIHPERQSDWNHLFDMQHYRIPTRLLDWTEVLGIAVFFAMLGTGPADAGVYVLSPTTLNAGSSKDGVLSVDDDPGFSYRELYWEKRPMPPVAPVAIQAKAQNQRIVAQRAVFTVHGTNALPLETQFPSAVRKVKITNRMKDGAKEYLRISGVNEFSVFPDIVGLAPFLDAIVGLK